jgi:hypothetical protein
MKKLDNDKALMSQALATIKGVKPLRKNQVMGSLVDVQHRVQTMKMTFAHFVAFLKSGLVSPASVQRQHEWRALTNKADYLNNFELPQTSFTVAYIDGRFEMLDGNTRVFKWTTQAPMVVPSHVNLSVLLPADRVELKTCFNCFDSAKAKKTRRHTLIGALRDAGVNVEKDLRSDFIRSGAFVTAMRVLCGYRTEEQMFQQVSIYKQEILTFDSFGFGEKDVEVPVQVAIFRLLKEGKAKPALLKNYADSFKLYRLGFFDNVLKSVGEIHGAALRAYEKFVLDTGKRSQEKGAARMSEVYYTLFRKFCQEVSKRGSKELAASATSYLRTPPVNDDAPSDEDEEQ